MKRTPVAILCIGFALLGLGLTGCMPKRAYRVPGERIGTSIDQLRENSDGHRAEVERHSVEMHEDFSLAFIEFDDRGRFWEPAQLDRATALIEEQAGGPAGPGAMIVVFVHGWKHNAQVCDENVACFRDVLTELRNEERVQAAASDHEPRNVVGVYLGWRGLSAKSRVLANFTFYTRKSTAHRIGRQGSVLRVFQELEAVRDRMNAGSDRSRLVILGHSFGGALTFSAVSELFEERLAKSADGLVQGVGDLVVLVNPAFEAARYNDLRADARTRPEFDATQPAALVTVTSESDAATKKMFPRGRRLATFLFWAWSKERKQKARRAVGHYEPFRTHSLAELEPAALAGRPASRGEILPETIIERSVDEARGVADCECRYWYRVEPRPEYQIELARGIPDLATSRQFRGVDLSEIEADNPPNNPFLMIGTTDEVVTSHNGIYNRLFIDFLRSLVIEMELRKSTVEARE